MNVHLMNQVALGFAALSLILSFTALANDKWYVRAAMWLALLGTTGVVMASSYATWCGLGCTDGFWFEDGDKAIRNLTVALVVVTFGVLWMFGLTKAAKPTIKAI